MNIFQLSCFLAVAEYLNFAQAAQSLHVTHPAVSQQIQSLEKELNVKLFRRTTRTVRLTEEGKAFLRDAQQIVALSERAKKRFGNAMDGNIETLTIGCYNFPCMFLLSDALEVLRSIRPELHPRLQTIPFQHIYRMLEEEDLDAVVGFRESAKMKIKAQYRSKVLAIFDQIPGLLSRHEKRVVFNKIVEGSMADQYEETFFWLSDSMIANECRRVSDPNVGLSLTESDTYIKCYLGDTGLLVSHAFDENELLEDEVYKQIFAGKLGLNEGMLYENVIAQMLASNGHRLFFYTQYNAEKRRNDIEIDFIIANNSKTKYKMYPIEVKSSAKYSFESLKRFKEKYKSRIGGCYIIHPRNLIEKDNILCIPPYMTICL